MDDIQKQIAVCCKQLKLSATLAERAMTEKGADNQEYLYHLLRSEVECRRRSRLAKYLNAAAFPKRYENSQYRTDEIDFPDGVSFLMSRAERRAEAGSRKAVMRRRLIQYVLFVLLCVLLAVSTVKGADTMAHDEDRASEERDYERTAAYIRAHTDPDDRISVCGAAGWLYVAADRIPASKYLYQFPIVEVMPSAKEEYFSDLRKTRPKIITVVNPGFYSKAYENNRVSGMPEFLSANGYVKSETFGFCDVYTACKIIPTEVV